ncbi:MAG: hypothetical protein WCT08_00415 [Patescibacteria group bacterium]
MQIYAWTAVVSPYVLAATFLLIIVFIFWMFFLQQKQKNRQVGIRYLPEKKPANQRGKIFYCPVCYLTSDDSGTCPNHDAYLQIQMLRGNPDDLEYYREMQKICGQ